MIGRNAIKCLVFITGHTVCLHTHTHTHTVNCWPSENGAKCDVNIEYELQQDYLELQDVVITIPIL